MTNLNRGSATIYAFPARGRYAVKGQHEEAAAKTRMASPYVTKAPSSSSWYHEEAISEADRTRKN